MTATSITGSIVSIILRIERLNSMQAFFGSIIGGVLTYYADVSTAFHVVIFFIFIDLFTGINRYWITYNIHGIFNKIKTLRSNKLWKTTTKLYQSVLVIALVYMLERLAGNFTQGYISNILAIYICLSEFKSIAENLDAINGNKKFSAIFSLTNNIFTKKFKDLEQINVSGSTILIVEDNNESYILMRDILRSLKCEIIRATDGADALTKLKHVDLAIVDMNLPILDGRSVIKVIKSKSPTIKIYVVTGDNTYSSSTLNVDEFSYKPIDVKLFKETVINLLK